MTDRSNGMMLEKRKRQNTYSSDDDLEDGSYDAYFTEERYRAMLGEHVHKYKRRHKTNNLPATGSTRNGTGMKNSFGSKEHKLGNGRPGALNKIKAIAQNPGHYKEADFAPEYGMDRFVLFEI